MKPARSSFASAALFVIALVAAPQAQCEVLKRTGPDPDPSKSRFGYSVSLSGDRMAIGKPGPGPSSMPSGSADVLERSPSGAWILAGTVVSSDGEDDDEFGYSVAIDGDTLVVGATDDGSLGAKGAAYVFERQPDGVWVETQKIVPPETNAWAFGWAADIDGDRFVVGAKGASSLGGGQGWAFVYEREGGSWVYKAPLQPSISVPYDQFGASLDIEGERLVVGADGNGPGLAFVFERDPVGTSWVETAVLVPDDLGDNDLFGQSVAISGGRIVVGAPIHSLPTLLAGAAYVFDLIDGVWTQTAKISLTDAPILSYFGWSTGVEGDRIAIGQRANSDIASGAGAAYLYEKGPSGWSEVAKYYGSGTGKYDSFSHALDFEGARVLVGAPNIAGDNPTPGYAFLFALDPAGPSLIADADEVSLSQGGTQTLQVGACKEHAGDLYFLAGTATGTTPGFPFAGFSVPLNPDVYFLHTVNHVGAPPLIGALGVLDFNGFGEATFSLPPGIEPALAGLVLHHAYCVLDAATLALEAVSPAVLVALVP